MRDLDILVPQYKETDEIIRPLLDSIAIQQNVDFDKIGVIITNDGTDVYLSDNLLNNYPFKIEYYKNEHLGVSGTRNACLDKSNAKYVMFCDADDLFFNACGLWIIFTELEKKELDYYSSKFIEETRIGEDKKAFYINRENDSTFVHGKIIRRQFLIDNNIRWNEKLTIHEDSYFNCLCQITAQRKDPSKFQYCPSAYYLWKWRNESVCRHDPLYLNKTYVNMYDSNTELIKECVKREYMLDAVRLATSMIYESYYMFNTDRWWSEDGHEYLLPTEKRFKKYWEDFEYLFNSISKEEKLKVVSNIRNKYFKQGLINEKITFDDWIKHIRELKENE